MKGNRPSVSSVPSCSSDQSPVAAKKLLFLNRSKRRKGREEGRNPKFLFGGRGARTRTRTRRRKPKSPFLVFAFLCGYFISSGLQPSPNHRLIAARMNHVSPLVAVVMGSKSDWDTIRHASEMLTNL